MVKNELFFQPAKDGALEEVAAKIRAEYESGDIRVQESELVEVKWFTRDALPPFPKRGSMGWRLITGVYG